MPAADSSFISLAEVLQSRPDILARTVGPSSTPAHDAAGVIEQRPSAQLDAVQSSVAVSENSVPAVAAGERCGCERSLALRDARLFRAALADALALRIDELRSALAADVLGRELQLERVDVERIALRLIAERDAEQPLLVRVAPVDAGLECGLPVSADPALAAGDVVLECRSGEIDARLSLRLRDVLLAEGAA